VGILTGNMDVGRMVVEEKLDISVIVGGFADPVTLGIADSLNAPNRKNTGFTHFVDLDDKRLHMLKEVAPRARRVGILLDKAVERERRAAHGGKFEFKLPGTTVVPFFADSLEEALRHVGNSKMSKIDAWFVYLMPPFYFEADARKLVDEMGKQKLPAIYERMRFVEWGGLMAYEPYFIDRQEVWIRDLLLLLDGVPAGKIPFEIPKNFYTTLNLDTAARLGLTIPSKLMRRIDLTFPCTVSPPLDCKKPIQLH
jgi:putative tryptophan/tyrosine transport system substrate-binding protein